MQPALEITSISPHFGSCLIHQKQLTNICCQKQCLSQRYLCNECIQLHKSHKYESTEQYTRRLVKKLISLQPKQRQQHLSLIRIFQKLHFQALQFQEQLEQTITILKQINLRKYSVIKCALKFKQEELYDQLCQWGMGENCGALEKIAKEMQEMCLYNKLAPQLYQQWTEDICNSISRLKNYSESLRDQALQMGNVLSYDQVVKKMKNEVKVKSEIKKNSVVIKVGEVEQKLDIQGQDKTQQQIIDMLQAKDITSFTVINFDRNGMGQIALEVLLRDRLPKLKKLILSNNLMEESGLQTILNLKQNLPNLQVLRMEGNFIDKDKAFTLISNIKQTWPNLQFSL